ncbi:MAG TPA: carboxypeptidase-like regulatory domain-containing protein, partial [Thermoanaerobaculia bacterium]
GAEVTTDHDGAFQLSGLRAGTHYLVVTSDRGFGSSLPLVDLQASTTFDIDIPTGGLRGRIAAAATGNPVPGALLAFEGSDPDSGTSFTGPSRQSGDGGLYELTGLAPGRYRVIVRKDGFAPKEGTVVVRPGQVATLDLTLQEAK